MFCTYKIIEHSTDRYKIDINLIKVTNISKCFRSALGTECACANDAQARVYLERAYCRAGARRKFGARKL